MIKREFRRLAKNPIMILVLIVILLIPTIYTIPFLSSMWDPYGRLSELPVAVVNEDQPVMYHDKILSVGDDLAKKLEENDSLDFHFVNAEEAERGLQDTTYYMTITIPKDFSQNAATVMDENPKSMELQYKTNPGTNYVASKLCTSAVEKIRTSVSEEVSRTYTESVFNGFDDITAGMKDATDGTDQMLSGENELIAGNGKITKGLGTLSAGSGTLTNGANQLSSGLKIYTAGVSAVDSGADQLGAGVITFQQQISTGVLQLKSGADSLEKGVTDYTAGVSAAKKGASDLTTQNAALNSGMGDLSGGVTTLTDGSAELCNGLKQLQAQLPTDSQGTVSELSVAMNQFGAALGQLNDKIQSYDGSTAGAGTVPNLAGKINAAESDLSKLESAENLTEEQKELVKAAKSQLASIDTNGTATAGTDSTLSEIKNTVNGLNSSYQDLSKNINDGVTAMAGGYTKIDTALQQKLIPGAEQINGGLTQLQGTVDSKLLPGVKNYTAGVEGLNTGLTTLNQNSPMLTGGAKGLTAGITTLGQGIDTGSKSLESAISQLSDGLKTLTENSVALNSGAGSLAKGAQQINSGAKELKKGSGTMGEGLTALQDGTKELKQGLVDGAEEVVSNKAGSSSIDMMASPVELNGIEEHPVKDNGHGMAAYMMSVALWVGALAFCLMYPLTKYSGELTSGFRWWLSKAIVLYPLAIGMALVMLLMLHRYCGFDPVDWKNTILLACVASLAFMSLMYFSNALLGRVGSFIMLVFMIIQLAGSAGTYPIEISGDFVADINPFLPFSYTVAGFRSTISGSEANLMPCYIMLLLILVVFTALSIWMFQRRAKKIKAGKHTFHDFIDNKGLA